MSDPLLDLIEEIKSELTPAVREEYLRRWDQVRAEIIEGDRGDSQRLCFESWLDTKDELLDRALIALINR